MLNIYINLFCRKNRYVSPYTDFFFRCDDFSNYFLDNFFFLGKLQVFH